MANEIRVRANLVSGTLSGALTNVATSMSAAGLANLPVIDTTNYAAITIENEIVWVTAHTAGATTATILRAQEGTSAAAHNSGVAWQHGPTAFDLGTDWTSYTPTLVQSVTVTKTVTYAKYVKIGRLVQFVVDLSVTGAGTAANPVVIGLPPFASAAIAVGSPLAGVGHIYDSSAGILYSGSVAIIGTSTVQIWQGGASSSPAYLGTASFTAGLASGDLVRITGAYESTT